MKPAEDLVWVNLPVRPNYTLTWTEGLKAVRCYGTSSRHTIYA